MASSFFKKPQKQILHQQAMTAFKENRLLGRGWAGDDQDERIRDVRDEFDIMFGLTRKSTEPHTIDYARSRARSCSLMLPGIPMEMFGNIGALFDADLSTIRFLHTEDGWTEPPDPDRQGFLWGDFSHAGAETLPTSQPPTVQDLFVAMGKQYEKQIQKAKERGQDLSKFMLEHNEIKANIFKEGLLGLWINNPEHKLHVLQLQQFIKAHYDYDLPIFIWNQTKGLLLPWVPSPQELKLAAPDMKQQPIHPSQKNLLLAEADAIKKIICKALPGFHPADFDVHCKNNNEIVLRFKLGCDRNQFACFLSIDDDRKFFDSYDSKAKETGTFCLTVSGNESISKLKKGCTLNNMIRTLGGRLAACIGNKFSLADSEDRFLLDDNGAVEVGFKNRDDAEKFRLFFKDSGNVYGEMGSYFVKLDQYTDLDKFFLCLRNMDFPMIQNQNVFKP